VSHSLQPSLLRSVKKYCTFPEPWGFTQGQKGFAERHRVGFASLYVAPRAGLRLQRPFSSLPATACWYWACTHPRIDPSSRSGTHQGRHTKKKIIKKTDIHATRCESHAQRGEGEGGDTRASTVTSGAETGCIN